MIKLQYSGNVVSVLKKCCWVKPKIVEIVGFEVMNQFVD